MDIVIRRKSKAEWLTLFVLFVPFVFPFLIELLQLPSMVKYVIDASWLCLLVAMLMSTGKWLSVRAKRAMLIVGVFFAVSLMSNLINYQSVLYYVWGLRNNLRFFVFFFACICFMKAKGIESCLRTLDIIYYINVPIVLVQYFVLGYSQDFLGGIFGVQVGCNGYSNILFVIVISKSLIYCLNKKENVVSCLIKCAIALFIAAISELKVFYLELILIAVFAAVMTRFSFKKLFIGLLTILGMAVSIRFLEELFPVFDDWFNLSKIIESQSASTGYTMSNDMSRLTTIPIALEQLLNTTFEKLFGLGLGNCDYASFDIVTTPFYRKFGSLNYTWFSSAFIILETGIVGIALYSFFFIYNFVIAGKLRKEKLAPSEICQLAQITAIMSIVFIFYNGTMRMESAFMVYYVLALPYICAKGKRRVPVNRVMKGARA